MKGFCLRSASRYLRSLFGLLLLVIAIAGFLDGCKESPPPDSSTAAKRKTSQPDWNVLFADDPGAYKEFQQVQAELRASNYPAVVSGLERLLARSPDAPWAEPLELMLIQAWRVVPDYPKALKQVNAFLEHRPRSDSVPRALLYKGEILLELAKKNGPEAGADPAARAFVSQALLTLQDLLKKYPEDRLVQAQAWFLLGGAYSAAGDPLQAKSAYRKVADAYTGTDYAPKALYRLSGLILSEGDVEGAGRVLREITERFSNSKESGKAREKLQGIEMVGSPAPELHLKEWIGCDPLALEDFRGRILLLDFWAIWCPHCRANIPKMDRLVEQYGSKGLAVLGVSRERSGFEAEKIRSFVDSHPMRYPTGVDDEALTSKAYCVENIPCIVAVDRDGTVRWHGHPDHLTDRVIEGLLGPIS
ncbi:MAG: redoxin domain-containing protein [bacterium]